jgi:uncharacterized protein (DUF433 family)
MGLPGPIVSGATRPTWSRLVSIRAIVSEPWRHVVVEHPRITLDPNVMVGKPVIRGTRITVELVLGLLAHGWTKDEIMAAYPHLKADDILACLAYAHDLVSSEKVFPIAAE